MWSLCTKLDGMGEEAGRFFFVQLLSAMRYLEQKHIVHRDLKIENVLLDANLNVKLCDFGYAINQTEANRKAYVGTRFYFAPEVLKE